MIGGRRRRALRHGGARQEQHQARRATPPSLFGKVESFYPKVLGSENEPRQLAFRDAETAHSRASVPGSAHKALSHYERGSCEHCVSHTECCAVFGHTRCVVCEYRVSRGRTGPHAGGTTAATRSANTTTTHGATRQSVQSGLLRGCQRSRRDGRRVDRRLSELLQHGGARLTNPNPNSNPSPDPNPNPPPYPDSDPDPNPNPIPNPNP